MATKTKKATTKGKKPSIAKKVNTSLVNASIEVINTTVDNGEKWQKLGSKLIKKSEKVRGQQINMIFDTAEAVKGQFISGTNRIKDLVGYDAELVEKAKDMATNNPVSKKVIGIVEEITEKVSENPMVQKAEKATEEFKNMGMAKYMELKEDVLEQASIIIDKGEAIIEDAKSTPKTKVTKKPAPKKTAAKKGTVSTAKATKTVVRKVTPTTAKATKTVARKATPSTAKATKTVAKKATAVKTVAKKASATKTVAKVAPKKTVVKKATTAKANVTTVATKAAPKAKTPAVAVKKTETAKVAEVKTEVTK